jgi:hypothetical protein
MLLAVLSEILAKSLKMLACTNDEHLRKFVGEPGEKDRFAVRCVTTPPRGLTGGIL